jgi:hypothetical protein
MGESIILQFDAEFYQSVPFITFTLEVSRTEMGMRVLHLQSDDTGSVFQDISKGERRFLVEIPNCLLYPANYEMHLCVWSQATGVLDYVEAISSFSMVQSHVTKRTQSLNVHKQAIFYTPSVWREIPLAPTSPSRTEASV